MKRLVRTVVFAIAVSALAACGNDSGKENEASNERPAVTKKVMQKNIEEVEKKAQSHTELDLATANSLIALYSDYARNNPDDPKTPEYLFKAGRIATTLRQGNQAVEYFDRAYSYEGFDKAPDALFLKGFVYESVLNDTANARKVYQEVIAKYPETSLANDAKASIDNLGKTPEELIREFEKKNKPRS